MSNGMVNAVNAPRQHPCKHIILFIYFAQPPAAVAPSAAGNGCVAYPGGKGGAEVQHCEGSGGHSAWPRLNNDMLTFFFRFTSGT